jgi:glycerol-3-phosphate acyltransferase PlsY
MSIASLAAALSYPLLIWHFSSNYLIFSICAAVFLMLTHAKNISRIVRGEEKPLTVGGKEEKEQTK